MIQLHHLVLQQLVEQVTLQFFQQLHLQLVVDQVITVILMEQMEDLVAVEVEMLL
tara:strand:- start:411 stop:575 length:165 start_codon:yes stop_codon:yes gene_type:complete